MVRCENSRYHLRMRVIRKLTGDESLAKPGRRLCGRPCFLLQTRAGSVKGCAMTTNTCSGVCGADSRDRMRLTVLEVVRHGPATLGSIVMELERMLAALDLIPCGISRCLQEMDRCGDVVLRNHGRGWQVAMGPHGAASLRQLAQARPPAPAGAGVEVATAWPACPG